MKTTTTTETTQAGLRKLAADALFAWLTESILPDMLQERADYWEGDHNATIDPWNNFSGSAIAENIAFDDDAADGVFDAWESLTVGQQRNMLADVWDCYIDSRADGLDMVFD